MKSEKDLVLSTFVKSRLGIDLPPKLPEGSLLSRDTLTDSTGRITSVEGSLFSIGEGSSDGSIISDLETARRDITGMLTAIGEYSRTRKLLGPGK